MSETLSETFLKCIDLERKADIEQTDLLLKSLSHKKLSLKGLAVINLKAEGIKTGLGGSTILELKNDSSLNESEEIQVGELRVGDIVKVDKQGVANGKSQGKSKKNDTKNDDEEDGSQTGCSGVISRISHTSIVITIDDQYEEKIYNLINDKLWCVKLSNSITFKRMESTMRKLTELKSPSPLIQILLNKVDFNISSNVKVDRFFNNNLNQSQKDAIEFSLNSPVTIIHGPPGTGKTYTLIEIIQQLYSKGERILVCGPSNISVDTILERLNDKIPNDELLRIGHPARLLSTNLKHSLDIVSNTSDQGIIVKELKKEIDDTIKKKIKKTRNYREKKVIWSEVKELKKDLKVRERKVTNELILKAKIVVSTLHGSSSRELLSIYKDSKELNLFDTIIIDEVSQSLEPQCWIPLISHPNVKRLILAGDNKQLPPTIKIDNNTKVKTQLETTLFDRLIKLYGDEKFKKLLNVQYRMNDKIMKFSSKTLYQGKLQSDETCSDILLTDFNDVIDDDDITSEPLVWYDTQGGEFHEQSNDDDDDKKNHDVIPSKFNEMEANVTSYHLRKLIKAGVSIDKIGIISPYNAQVALLKKLTKAQIIDEDFGEGGKLEISTVDGFQGREKEVIIISLVRSNDEGEIGFLKDERRLNVAITRAKRQLCIIGDIETLTKKKNKFMQKLCSFMEDEAMIIYPDINDIL